EGPKRRRSRLRIMVMGPRSKSGAEYGRACRVIPGGVNSAARAFGAVGGNPILIERAEGPFLYDIDGHRYIDFIGSWGPMILGHGDPTVVQAVRESLDRRFSYGTPTRAETKMAELIAQAFP